MSTSSSVTHHCVFEHLQIDEHWHFNGALWKAVSKQLEGINQWGKLHAPGVN